ncbi:MAG: hypothetical protein ABT11_15570 [Novosphingobium sp. SCN 66-18]|nr:MAG: hypothetical protein ABT11_15570 [Novosphingobium sp. SCN 66-18]
MHIGMMEAIALITIVFALQCGSKAEKWGGFTLVAMGVIHAIGDATLPLITAQPLAGQIAAHVVGLTMLVVISIRSTRWWPLFSAAFLLISLVSYAAGAAIGGDTAHVLAWVSWWAASAVTFAVFWGTVIDLARKHSRSRKPINEGEIKHGDTRDRI